MMQRVFEHRCACGEAACTEPEGAPKYHAHLFGGHHLRAESRRLARHETCRTPLLHHPRGCFGCYEAPPWCQPQKERGPRGDERKHTSDPDQTKKMAKKIVTSSQSPIYVYGDPLSGTPRRSCHDPTEPRLSDAERRTRESVRTTHEHVQSKRESYSTLNKHDAQFSPCSHCNARSLQPHDGVRGHCWRDCSEGRMAADTFEHGETRYEGTDTQDV